MVARPRWLSGMRNASATGLSTSICLRTCSMSGRREGSISHRTAKRSLSRNDGGGSGEGGTVGFMEFMALRIPYAAARVILFRGGRAYVFISEHRAHRQSVKEGGHAADSQDLTTCRHTD